MAVLGHQQVHHLAAHEQVGIRIGITAPFTRVSELDSLPYSPVPVIT